MRLWVPKRDVIQKLDRLTAMRNRLIKARKMLQSPLTDSDSFISKKDYNEEKQACQSTMDALKKDIKQVKIDIENTIQGDPYLKELYELIESVKGVGPAIATEILIVTNEFKNITDPKKFACHAGVVPFVYSSGQYKGKAKTSNKANKQLKALLHNGAMSAIQHSPEIKEYYLTQVASYKVGHGSTNLEVRTIKSTPPMSDQVKIVTETTYLYVIVDDILKSIRHSEDIRAQCSDSEIITTALVAALHYGSNHSDAIGFVQETKLMPKMVESIGAPKRPFQSAFA